MWALKSVFSNTILACLRDVKEQAKPEVATHCTCQNETTALKLADNLTTLITQYLFGVILILSVSDKSQNWGNIGYWVHDNCKVHHSIITSFI